MNGSAVTSFVEAEVRCIHCGHSSGVIRRDRGDQRAPTTFHGNNGGPVAVIRGLTDLRCDRCGGSVFTDDFEVKYVYPKIDFLDDRPRRGRPPKRLVELRRAAQEASLRAS